jgi:ribonuclease BN (tRNA processing enzyme)
MNITVLGSSPVRPNPGRACSGYLLEAGDRRYLVDCGTGVLGQLLRHSSLNDLDAVLITHLHPDHCLDLVNIRQALAHGPGPRRTNPLPVYVGPGLIPPLRQLGAVFREGGTSFWDDCITFETFDPAATLVLGELHVSFARTEHYVPCWAMRFEHGGRVCVFTADTGPSEAVAALAAGAHLVIAESALLHRNGHAGIWGHMSAQEAGELAAAAGAEQLVLTHYFVEDDPIRLAAAAQAVCTAPVYAAEEGKRYAV